MTPALSVALLLLAAPPTTVGAPPAASSPAPAVANASTTPAEDLPLDLDQLRQMYRDTCEAREFGAYDDMCDQLRQQVRQAERDAAQAARRRPKTTATPASPP